MDTEGKKFIGYHGTDYNGEKCIIRSRHFNLSNRDDEWLGSGIYFFIDENQNEAVSNALKWAINFKGFKFYTVLQCNISIEKNRLIDFNNDETWRSLFHDYRKEVIKDIKSRGIKIQTSKHKFDCKIINEICEKFNILAVKQQRYISKLENSDLPMSEVPNCTILCVRDNCLLDEQSIKVKRRGKYE
ncbi:hypothetical protein [Clostridium guangxiense]|uniref:hypothetical protein n=1 Tax=Clostridium guangxiense TaxID=1662055 RepID=UPI001E581CD4|nr:hypothetical protein [Clostridium guangxiense]MCD2348487.1 hypothetical protein [Clostridium guangxiense]